MKEQIRIGSRESKLAVTQAEIIKALILKHFPAFAVEIITMKTTGDMILDRNLDQIGGKGLFVKELDIALMENRIDLAVHSLKDMPMEIPAAYPVFAYSKREDPRDVLIYKPGSDEIPEGGIIATSSKRRMIQLQKLYPQSQFTNIRGNVQTRLRKLAEQDLDGTVLAAAGVNRLHLEAVIGRVFSIEEVLPAAGQGILALQGNQKMKALLKDAINDQDSEVAALSERGFITELDGGCSSPIAAYAEVGEQIILSGLYYRESDQTYYIEKKTGARADAFELGVSLAKEMRETYG